MLQCYQLASAFYFCLLAFSSASLATVFDMPPNGTDLVGEVFTIRTKAHETLDDISKRYRIGYHEILEANPNLHPYKLRAGQKIIMPGEFILPKFRSGVVINTAEPRLFYFSKDGKKVYTYPVGLGRKNWRTPLTKTHIRDKKEKPSWYPTENIRNNLRAASGKELPKVVPPGPDNPLGPFAIYLGLPTYLIHGTNRPDTIGKYVGAGCVRMYNADMSELYSLVEVNDLVRISHYPYKIGWANGMLYLEAHKPVALDKPASKLNKTDVEKIIQYITNRHQANIKWRAVDHVIHAHTGMPIMIGQSQ